jgi:predicted Zn-dependent protease
MITTLQPVQAVVHEARRLGARGAEALLTTASGRALRTDGRGIPHAEPFEEARLAVRVWLEGGRRAEAIGDPGEASRLVAQAIAAAARAPVDPAGGPVPRLQAPPRGLGIDDLRHDQLTEDDRTDVVVTNHRAAARAPGVVGSSFWYREVRQVRRFANTHGVALEVPSTTYEAGGRLDVRLGDDRVSLREVTAGRAFASIACLPYGAQLAERAAQLARDPVPLVGPQRVLLPARAMGKLVAWLADVLRDESLAPGSTLAAGASAGPLFHRRLHLVDDGGLPGGLRTRGFDDRGVAPVPLTLLREGCVAARYLDPEAARRLDLRPTGHVVEGALAPSNLQLNSGTRSTSALLGEQDRLVVEVDDLDDLSGLDRVTGDLDLPVDVVVWDRHTPRGALRRARLRGNLVDALRHVVAVTSDTDRILHVDAPGVIVDGLEAVPRR